MTTAKIFWYLLYYLAVHHIVIYKPRLDRSLSENTKYHYNVDLITRRAPSAQVRGAINNKWAQFKRENARGDDKTQLLHNVITFLRSFLTHTRLEGTRRDAAVVAILDRFVIEYRIYFNRSFFSHFYGMHNGIVNSFTWLLDLLPKLTSVHEGVQTNADMQAIMVTC